MSRQGSRMTSAWGWRLRRLGLALLVLLASLPARSAEVLLTGLEDSPGVRAFTGALAQQRPNDQIRFVPLAQMPDPSRLPPATRLRFFAGAFSKRVACLRDRPELVALPSLLRQRFELLLACRARCRRSQTRRDRKSVV